MVCGSDWVLGWMEDILADNTESDHTDESTEDGSQLYLAEGDETELDIESEMTWRMRPVPMHIHYYGEWFPDPSPRTKGHRFHEAIWEILTEKGPCANQTNCSNSTWIELLWRRGSDMSEVLYKLFFHLFAIITRNTHAHLCLMPVRRLCAARHMRGARGTCYVCYRRSCLEPPDIQKDEC